MQCLAARNLADAIKVWLAIPPAKSVGFGACREGREEAETGIWSSLMDACRAVAVPCYENPL